jgi:uncharacterized protein (TIGR02996 family)
MSLEKERVAFTLHLNEKPYDKVARLAYADWLEEQGQDDKASRQRQLAISREWLREFAIRHSYGWEDEDWQELEKGGKDRYGESYTRDQLEELKEQEFKEFIEFLSAHLDGHDGFFGFVYPMGFKDYSEEMWQHFEIVTGKPPPTGAARTKVPGHFRCAC